MDENNVINADTVAGKLLEIAEGMSRNIGCAIQKGYQAAAGSLFGRYGEVTISKNDWSDDGDGMVSAEIELKDINENDMIIFSPKTVTDRTDIDYAEMFVSPEIKDSKVSVTCVREPKGDITMVYIVVRSGVV